jgi:phosphatidylethanolamine-binding protein (PEBP) family uncharacterized protein
VVIQPVPAIPGNVVGNVILDLVNKICWELVAISTNSAQLVNTWNGTTYPNNYFTFVSLFQGTATLKPCEECEKAVNVVEPVSDCIISLRNWSDCKSSDTKGEIYINGIMFYSFDENFDVNIYLSTLNVNNGDIIKIYLYAPSNSVATLYTELTSGNNTQTVSGGDYVLEFRVECGEKPQKIDIFSTCKKNAPTITLYSTSYTEAGILPVVYYSTSCLQSNTSPEMTWILNNFNGLSVISFEILCEDLDASGSSPDGYFVHWWVKDIDPSQLNIAAAGSWISATVLPTDYGSGDAPNGWNGPCPLVAPSTHNYRIQITANLVIGGPVVSNYSTFGGPCISPFC